MPTIVKGPVKRSICNLCGKEVAELPNGRHRYHSCHSDPGTRPIAEQLPQGYGVDASGNPTPRSEAILAQSNQEVPSTMTSATATPVEAEDESQEIADEAESQEAEVTLAGKTVEDATPGKPKRPKAEPKAAAPKAEPKVPDSVLKARAEREAMVDRTKAISKLNGKGENARVVLHLFDPEADRTLCGAVVPAGDDNRKSQGWYTDGSPATKEQMDSASECPTCSARMAKLQSGGSIRRRVARKPGEAQIGTPIVKAGKGDEGVVHLTNAASDPLRTLCGAVIGAEAEGWVPAEDPGVVIGCPTCRAREAKLTAQAETDAAITEAKTAD